MKKKLTLFICLFIPSSLAVLLLKLIGHKIGKKVKIGISIIHVDSLELYDNSSIGHFNLITINKIKMDYKAYIKMFNVIRGPFDIEIANTGAIGTFNTIQRAKIGVSYGTAVLKLGILSKITSYHFIDLTRSITFGNYTTLAGIRSQIWTHGYFHASEGPDRFRVDGEVKIGHNVYIGSGCLINPGIEVSDSINIGGNSSISKSLYEKGMYVSQGLRYFPKDYDETKAKLNKIEIPGLEDEIYEK